MNPYSGGIDRLFRAVAPARPRVNQIDPAADPRRTLLAGLTITEDVLREQPPIVVVEAWKYRQESLTDHQWLNIWDTIGYVDNGVPADRPTEPVHLWRGATAQRRHRMSWTSDRAHAEAYARAHEALFSSTGETIWHAIVHPAFLLSRHDIRVFMFDISRYVLAGDEYVVNPAGLADTNVWESRPNNRPSPLIIPVPQPARPPRPAANQSYPRLLTATTRHRHHWSGYYR